MCNDLCIDTESELLPIDGEVFTSTSSYTQDGAKLDTAANGFGMVNLNALFYLQVFNPHAPSL